MISVNRGAFRVSEQALAQHETALAQAVSKAIQKESLEQQDIIIINSNVKSLGTFLLTGIYIQGRFHAVIRTWADLDNVYDLKTTVETGLMADLPESVNI